jgi:hypothetical protein
MVTNDDKKIRLKRIEVVDGAYYGIVNDSRKTKLQLDEKYIKELRPLDQAKTSLGNVGFAVLGTVIIVVLIVAATYEPVNASFGE